MKFVINNIYLQGVLYMYIETTININRGVLARLIKASQVSGKSKSHIISCLMQRLSNDSKYMEKAWSRIQYQDRGNREEWRCIHMRLGQHEYEFFIDLRKFYKFSVSFLITYAIKKYLDEIVSKILNSNDTYNYINYVLSRIIISGVVCWVIYWGLPNNLLSTIYRFRNQMLK